MKTLDYKVEVCYCEKYKAVRICHPEVPVSEEQTDGQTALLGQFMEEMTVPSTPFSATVWNCRFIEKFMKSYFLF